ncbi:MAG: hypothetical protein GXY53_09960 [Desulfobulbus sp.]|nr:hypothetical protein [Desulfobulbus sp.]
MNIPFDTDLLPAATPNTVNRPAANADRETLKKSCQDFEAIFIQSLFKAMRKTVPGNSLFSRNSTTAMFEEMIHQELAATMARTQSIGLAGQMYRQMEKNLPPEK